MSAEFEDRQQVIVIVRVGNDLKDERWIPDAAQGGGGKERAVEAVADPFAQYAQWTAVEMINAVRNCVEKSLDFNGTIQTVEQVKFCGGELGLEKFQGVFHSFGRTMDF
jgi:hypothetical protein